jgi:GTP-binding protein
LIADVGLVGLPNAGKSTLLKALTAATPQVAAYPFTTLEPNLGVLDLSVADASDERRVTIADMPGLIEGASGGAGLGHAFLRHISRTRVIVHVVDLAAADPERDYQIIREELQAHDAQLLEKVTLVVGNKIDLETGEQNSKAFAKARKKEGNEFVAVSAAAGEGLGKLIAIMARLLPDADTLAQPGEPAGVVVHRFESAPDEFTVRKEDDGYRVIGKRIQRIAAQTDFENEESAERFQRDLARLGVERELVNAGVEPGDTVRIGTVDLEWAPETSSVRG